MPATYTERMDGFRRGLSVFCCGGAIPALILVTPIHFRAMLHDSTTELDRETEPDLISIGIKGRWNGILVVQTQILAPAPGWRFL